MGILLQNALKLITLIGGLYALVTYVSWFWASQQNWCNADHGNLQISFVDKVKISAFIVSPHSPKVRTDIEGEFPVLFQLQNVKFNVASYGNVGTSRITLMPNKISIALNYKDPLHKPAVFIFTRCD